MVKKASKKTEGEEIEEVLDELLADEQPKKKSAKKIKKEVEQMVEEPQVEDLDEENRISYAEIIAILTDLPKDDFKNVIKVAKQVRRTNNMIATYFGEDEDDR